MLICSISDQFDLFLNSFRSARSSICLFRNHILIWSVYKVSKCSLEIQAARVITSTFFWNFYELISNIGHFKSRHSIKLFFANFLIVSDCVQKVFGDFFVSLNLKLSIIRRCSYQSSKRFKTQSVNFLKFKITAMWLFRPG